MKTSIRLSIVASVFTLAACGDGLLYGKADAPSITVTNAMHNVPGTVIPIDVNNAYLPLGGIGNSTLPFDLGSVPAGDLTKDSTISINSGVLEGAVGSDPALFTKITSAKLFAVLNGVETLIASYNATTDGASTNAKLPLKPVPGVNLYGFLQDKVLSVRVSVSGQPPTTSWSGDVALDFHVTLLAKVI